MKKILIAVMMLSVSLSFGMESMETNLLANDLEAPVIEAFAVIAAYYVEEPNKSIEKFAQKIAECESELQIVSHKNAHKIISGLRGILGTYKVHPLKTLERKMDIILQRVKVEITNTKLTQLERQSAKEDKAILYLAPVVLTGLTLFWLKRFKIID